MLNMSAIGILHHTPWTPMAGGKMSKSGNRKMICRESEMSIERPGLRMDWKKAVAIICVPTNGKVQRLIRNAGTQYSMSVWSVVKIDANCAGKKKMKTYPVVRMNEATLTAKMMEATASITPSRREIPANQSRAYKILMIQFLPIISS